MLQNRVSTVCRSPLKRYIHIVNSSSCGSQPSECIGGLSKARSIRRVALVLGKGGIKAEERHGRRCPVQVGARSVVVGYAT
jgi:hypothetical protein